MFSFFAIGEDDWATMTADRFANKFMTQRHKWAIIL
jgi:hypothetical protein